LYDFFITLRITVIFFFLFTNDTRSSLELTISGTYLQQALQRFLTVHYFPEQVVGNGEEQLNPFRRTNANFGRYGGIYSRSSPTISTIFVK
jgi:hypothetical protein